MNCFLLQLSFFSGGRDVGCTCVVNRRGNWRLLVRVVSHCDAALARTSFQGERRENLWLGDVCIHILLEVDPFLLLTRHIHLDSLLLVHSGVPSSLVSP